MEKRGHLGGMKGQMKDTLELDPYKGLKKDISASAASPVSSNHLIEAICCLQSVKYSPVTAQFTSNGNIQDILWICFHVLHRFKLNLML